MHVSFSGRRGHRFWISLLVLLAGVIFFTAVGAPILYVLEQSRGFVRHLWETFLLVFVVVVPAGTISEIWCISTKGRFLFEDKYQAFVDRHYHGVRIAQMWFAHIVCMCAIGFASSVMYRPDHDEDVLYIFVAAVACLGILWHGFRRMRRIRLRRRTRQYGY